MAQAPRPTTQPPASALPVTPPQDHMAEQQPQHVPEHVKPELEFGAKAASLWEKQRQEEFEVGKKLVEAAAARTKG